MKRFRAKYKCRYCGEEFGHSLTDNEGIALDIIVSFTCGLHRSQKYGCPIYDKELHVGENADHIGLGDFIGFEIEEVSN